MEHDSPFVSMKHKRKREEGNETDQGKDLPLNPKAPKLEYSSVVKKMMASMGYMPGEGLGKEKTGITKPVEESTHKGRRGFGYLLEGLEREEVLWEEEEVEWKQQPEWLESTLKDLPTASELKTWKMIGDRKDTIEDETQFCDADVLQKILSAKTVFDHLSSKEFLDARQRSNPFETIKGAIFQNRAAMKMANMDAVFDFVFTNPKKNGKPLLSSFDVLYFADICAGPGGFSEYVLWRKKWEAKGFGFTLKDPKSGADFKLDQFLSAPCETFDAHYGVGGYEGDGDVTQPDNLQAFREYVMEQTNGKGVHFVMADGGFSVEGQENIQEILTKQLVLCQYVCALSILGEGGHFVCKVFDMFTPFSVGLFYLLYRCFNDVCLFKPVTSRPANSERYVVCVGRRPESDAVLDYLFHINDELHRLKQEKINLDVIEVVPSSVLDEEPLFTSYVHSFNDRFGINQIMHLKKLQYFVKNSVLYDHRQVLIRAKCLELWKIPATPRTLPSESYPLEVLTSVWKDLQSRTKVLGEYCILNSEKFHIVDCDNLSFVKDIHSWKWCWACGRRYLLIGLGRNKVLGWDMRGEKPAFSQLKEYQGLELPKGTVIEVECVQELTGEGSGQRRRDTVYVMDVISIHNEIIGHRPFKERILLAQKLCKVVNKPCRKGAVLLKTKNYQRVSEATKNFLRLKKRDCKGHREACLTASVSEDDKTFVIVKGIIFVRPVNDPWQLCLGRSGSFYYFNRQSGESTYDCPTSSVSSFVSMVNKRRIWMLTPNVVTDFVQFGLTKSSQDRISSVGLTFGYLKEAIQQNVGIYKV